jgi:hypothetical protein
MTNEDKDPEGAEALGSLIDFVADQTAVVGELMKTIGDFIVLINGSPALLEVNGKGATVVVAWRDVAVAGRLHGIEFDAEGVAFFKTEDDNEKEQQS